MSCDGFVTGDIFFACALMFVYGEESLTRIEGGVSSPSGKRFSIEVASEDAKILNDDFQNSKLAISDLMAYVKIYSQVTRRLKLMQRQGETEWCSESWIRGKGR